MRITLDVKPLAALETEALVTYVFEEPDLVQGRIAEIDQAAKGLLRKLAKGGELTGKTLEMTLIHAPAGLKAARLLLVGAGKREKFDSAVLRKNSGSALRYLKSRGVHNFAFAVRENNATEDVAQALAEGFLAADFESDKYKTDKKNDKSIDSVLLAGFSESERSSAERGLARGTIIGESQNFARDLINEPSNKLTPKILAEKAEAMAKQAGLAADVLDEKRIADLKMGALLSVAQGSVEPPRMIVITYSPASAPKSGAPVIGIVGKAVTFDTGGISIKPSEGMEKMKYDMAGGATMLGVIRALAALKPNVKVICVVPATENMPGGRAQKPGDIQTAMSGKTIEVLNTDAEGRLILADAVHYAKQLGATHLVDAATLTGAIVVALASINVGVFGGTDQAWTDKVIASAKAAGEKMWQMPMDDEYREYIKGTVADIQNIGSGKGGGSITGAWFIREFAGDTPWVHLDIAGTAWNDDAKPWLAKGPTGVALRTLVQLVMSY
ncbi:MAG: leucyl aminopeptidase [Candidatus Acidiferrum sp.]